MSAAGTIFRDIVFELKESDTQIAGTRTFPFDVENDGIIVTVERLTGSATLTGTLKSVYPAPMASQDLFSFTVNDSTLNQFGKVTYKQAAITLNWDGPGHFKVAIKMVSAAALEASSTIILSDDVVTTQVNATTSAVAIVNAGTRKTIAVRHWGTTVSTDILFVGEIGKGILAWPLAYREGVSIDIDANAVLYIVTDTGTIDTRIMQVTKD